MWLDLESLYRGNEVKMSSLEWATLQYDWYSYIRGKFGHREAQKEDHVKKEGENGHLQTKKRGGTNPFLMALRRIQPWWHFDLGLLASNTVRQHISVV